MHRVDAMTKADENGRMRSATIFAQRKAWFIRHNRRERARALPVVPPSLFTKKIGAFRAFDGARKSALDTLELSVHFLTKKTELFMDQSISSVACIARIKDSIRTVKEYRKKEIEEQVYRVELQDYARHNPLLTIPEDIRLTDKDVDEVSSLIRFNETIADYYERLCLEENNITESDGLKNPWTMCYDLSLKTKADEIRACGKSWFFDVYHKQFVHDLKGIQHCHDKFCLHCQKLLQATRLQNYAPLIENEIADGKFVYHITFTVPNPKGFSRQTIKRMYDNFKKIIKMFSGNSKNSTLSSFGYRGALRSLEITTKNNNGKREYHPHLHSIWSFKQPLFTDKTIKNKYSYDYKGSKRVFCRAFSNFEITLQKVWYLLWHGEKVTAKNIENLELGYSCTADEVTDNFYEAFKYTVKIGRAGDASFYLDYEDFKVIYFALKKTRVFQTYGCFYNNDIDNDKIDESLIERYDRLIAQLQLVELPDQVTERLDELADKIRKNPHIRFLSRKSINKFLKDNPEFLSD